MRRYAGGEGRFDRPSGQDDPDRGAPVVLMVSGGADSTALLVMAATSKLDIDDGRGLARIARERLHVLHVNHCLRGMDAEEDEEFVRELSARYGIPCTVRRVDVAARAEEARQRGDATSGNVENAGREARYAAATDLANRLAQEHGVPRSAVRILTAHTADDRAETFFMNAIRGTGPAGLSSIPRRRNRIVRPLIDLTHDQLCDMLRMRGIVWREDDTNHDTRYLRAYVRHELMPVAKRRNARVAASLATTCDILSDEDAFLNLLALHLEENGDSEQVDKLLERIMHHHLELERRLIDAPDEVLTRFIRRRRARKERMRKQNPRLYERYCLAQERYYAERAWQDPELDRRIAAVKARIDEEDAATAKAEE